MILLMQKKNRNNNLGSITGQLPPYTDGYMKSRTYKLKCRLGLSLLDALFATAALTIIVTGTSAYRYYAALDARKADVYITAARTALLLCESWHGLQGAQTYDPAAQLASELTITSGNGPAVPSGFNLLGKYNIQLNDANYYVTLSYKDVTGELRALNVNIAWPGIGRSPNGFNGADKSFQLTTYTLK